MVHVKRLTVVGIIFATLALLSLGANNLVQAQTTTGPTTEQRLDNTRAELAKARKTIHVQRSLLRDYRRFRTPVQRAIALAATTYGVSLRDMRRVAWCESRFNPRALHPQSRASGLFQFLPSTWRDSIYRRFSPFDAMSNALAAGKLQTQLGWRPWVCQP